MLLELVDSWLGGLEGGFFPLLVKILFNPFVKGMTAILANQGVAEMLTINLIGSNAFVIAYAVANLHNHISPLRICQSSTEENLLDNNPHSSFTSSPPPVSSSIFFIA